MGLYSLYLSSKPRDVNHPYGHGKAEFVSSAIEGALIFIAGIMIINESVHQLLDQPKLKSLNIGMLLIGITGLVNFLFGTYIARKGKSLKSLVLQSGGKHLRVDAYSTFAILVGLGLVKITNWLWLDSVVALLFAIVIIYTGYKVIRKSLAGIMDEADTQLLQEMVQYLQDHRKENWIDLHNLRVIQYGSRLHVDTHMTLPWFYDIAQAETEIHSLEALIDNHFNSKIELFVHIDACKPYSCKLCAMSSCDKRIQTFVALQPWTMRNVWENAKHGKEPMPV
jgi:cation diffusion facilitator family transporter